MKLPKSPPSKTQTKVLGKAFLKTITIALVDNAAPATPAIPNRLGRVKKLYAIMTAKTNAPTKPTTTVSKFSISAPERKLTKNKRANSNHVTRGLMYNDCNKIEAMATAQPTITITSISSTFNGCHLTKRLNNRLK